ncbi:hypothetical protein SAMN05216359_10322 [Roseateles sp. YR242]|uniref:hypothetical protein n=1 Tax=Roseateles sp. YR242 TaxID=1855305 RepID=UPI0008B0D3AF|nr:hypothetical protein [Roseateles sp. YR242]SEK77131.1 hypothetical protein SAMN05216359_10322 [Roseateles sp. YR242]
MSEPAAPSRPAPLDSPTRPVAALPAVGERLGVWRVADALFEVGSGHWFRVEHALAAGEAGLALVYRHEADAQAVLMRFAEDSDALGRLDFPTYGAPLDSGLSPAGSPYLVVPAMEGAPLMRVAMALPLRRRMELLLELVALLDAAQARGLVLHELDPGMLWLSPSQQLHWLGQGLAPRASQAPALLVRAAEPLADPRQRAGARPDGRSEAHALGRLLGLLINGRLPRKEGTPEGRGGDTTAVETAATPVASLQSWLSLSAAHRDSLDRLLDRAMTDGHTFPDRASLAQAVRDWLDQSASVLAARVAQAPAAAAAGAGIGPHTGTFSMARPSAPVPLQSSPDERPPLRPPGSTLMERVAGVVALLVVAALLLWLLLRSH